MAARRVAMALTVVLLAAGSVAGADPAAGLAGEELHGTSLTPTAVACDPSGTSTLTYSVSGTAVGPYPGTFEEDITIVVGPQDQPPIPGVTDVASGDVVGLTAAFTIDSPAGQVTGTKEVTASVDPARPNFGTCATFTSPSPFDPLCAGSPGGPNTFDVRNVIAQVSYEAEIAGPTGTSTDEGTGQVGITDILGDCAAGGSPVLRSFVELFLVSDPAPAQPAALVLTPAAAVNEVGTEHTVTATVTDVDGDPVAGASVVFTVEGSVTADGSCTTDTAGSCDFTYGGPALPGADVITAVADVDGDGGPDPGEPVAEATKTWVLPVSTPGHVTGGGFILATGRVNFALTAKADSKGTKGSCNVVDQTTGVHVHCTTVDTVVVVGTHATLFGEATVDGVPATYRIDVDDLGEPGRGRDTFRIQTSTGYLAGGVLAGGNIQIHKAK